MAFRVQGVTGLDWLLDAWNIFYFSFLFDKDAALNAGEISDIKKYVSAKAKELLKSIKAKLKKKNMTEDGRARKARINPREIVFSRKEGNEGQLGRELYKNIVLVY